MGDRNNNANKFLFLAGIITGAAAAVYLNTPHGKKVRNAIVEKADEVKTTVSDKATEYANSAKETGRKVLDKATEQYEHAKASAKNALDSASNTITSVKERFIDTTEKVSDQVTDVAENQASNLKDGVNKAKRKLNDVNA